MTWFTVLVLAVGLERLAEVWLSRLNTAWSLAHGGVETGRRLYPVMVLLHIDLLLMALLEVWLLQRPFFPTLGVTMLALLVLAQALRWWCIAVLGRQWSTRVVVVPGMRRVTRGPYRYLKHPNYLAVVIEGFALPLVHTAWITAVVFSVANAALLAVRIRTEDRALATLRDLRPTEAATS